MTQNNGSLFVQMDYEDDFVPTTVGAPADATELKGDPPPDPVIDPVSDLPPDPAPDPDPVDPAIFDGSPAAAFGMALSALEPFSEIKVDKNAKIEDVLPLIESSWAEAKKRADEHALAEYKQIAEEISLYKSGRPDMIQELAPLKTIATLPIMPSDTVTVEQSEENMRSLITALYTQIKGNSPEEADILYNRHKEAGKTEEMAKAAAVEFGTLYINSVQQVQEAEKAKMTRAQEQAKEQYDRVHSTIKTLLGSKKLLGLSLTEDDTQQVSNAIYDTKRVVEYEVVDDFGKKVKKTGTLADQFFDEFDQNPELQLYFLHRWLKGDFNKPVVRDIRNKEIDAKIANLLNQSATKVSDENKMFIE